MRTRRAVAVGDPDRESSEREVRTSRCHRGGREHEERLDRVRSGMHPVEEVRPDSTHAESKPTATVCKGAPRRRCHRAAHHRGAGRYAAGGVGRSIHTPPSPAASGWSTNVRMSSPCPPATEEVVERTGRPGSIPHRPSRRGPGRGSRLLRLTPEHEPGDHRDREDAGAEPGDQRRPPAPCRGRSRAGARPPLPPRVAARPPPRRRP